MKNLDIISRWLEKFYDYCYGLSDPSYNFFLRADLILVVGLLFCYLSWKQTPSPTKGRQLILFTIGVLVGGVIPLEKISEALVNHRILKTWLLVIAVVALYIFPKVVPVYVVNDLGFRKRMTMILYISIGVLFLLNILLK